MHMNFASHLYISVCETDGYRLRLETSKKASPQGAVYCVEMPIC